MMYIQANIAASNSARPAIVQRVLAINGQSQLPIWAVSSATTAATMALAAWFFQLIRISGVSLYPDIDSIL